MLSREATDKFSLRNKGQGLRLRRALLGRHQDLFEFPYIEIKRLRASARMSLWSGNPYSRNRWMRALGGHLCHLLGAEAPDFVPRRPVYFLTILDSRNVRTTEQAVEELLEENRPNINELNPIELIVARYYHLLWMPINCVGMVEPAVYVSCRDTLDVSPTFSYHFHAIVWGLEEREMSEICEDISYRVSSSVANTAAAQFERVRDGDLLQMIWYMTKMPRKQYQLFQKETGRQHQFKGQINGVNSVRIYADMRDITLDQLLIAKGDGERVKRRLLADCARWQSNLKP